MTDSDSARYSLCLSGADADADADASPETEAPSWLLLMS